MRDTPTSTTVAPGFTCAAVIIRAAPAAAMIMSDSRQTSTMSVVKLCATVTVASAPRRTSNNICGKPTSAERPMTVTRLPTVAILWRSSKRITPSGVHGT